MVWGSTHSVAPLLQLSCKGTCISQAGAQVGAGLVSILWLSLNSWPGQSTLVYWGRGGGNWSAVVYSIYCQTAATCASHDQTISYVHTLAQPLLLTHVAYSVRVYFEKAFVATPSQLI